MSEKEFTVLDHIEGITVPGKVFEEPANEFWQLLRLWQGMEFLYRPAKKLDGATAPQSDPDKKFKMFASANALIDGLTSALLTCSFDWYSISATQYVRTVGAIAYRQNNSCPTPIEYVDQVIPEIKIYRDKVAAHFAWGTQHKNDKPAERQISVIPNLSFSNDTWVISGLMLTKKTGDKISDSSALQPWSISKVHEQLRKRYWPESLKEESATNDA